MITEQYHNFTKYFMLNGIFKKFKLFVHQNVE